VSDLVVVTGATGYIGSRLVSRLAEAGYRVRCVVRDAGRFDPRPYPGVEVVEADALRPTTLPRALEGARYLYYLIHSMGGGHGGFDERDRRAGKYVGWEAAHQGIERIVYLSGLGHGPDLSPHLRSRQETGEALREGGVPVTELRAGIIVGSGSAGFEMIRALTERLPVMVCPRWVTTRSQPIAVRDVLRYLVECLERPETTGRILEVGGADVLTYKDMMLGYADVRGLRRHIVVVPVLTPRLSSYWVTLVPASIARPLIEGLRSEAVVTDRTGERLLGGDPLGYEEAVRLALDRMSRGEVESVWAGAAAASSGPPRAERLRREEGMVVDHHVEHVPATPAQVFAVVSALGGERGWLYANQAWQLRGLLDRMVGGVGMRRGRRDPRSLRIGDALDFWRVEAVEPDERVLLRAEMKVPGRAWLEIAVAPEEDGSRLETTALFEPKGLGGMAYWYGLLPVHRLIFSGMSRAIAQECAKAAAGRSAVI
jgi:uncharacterized protein YbjT (DUF2867 family)